MPTEISFNSMEELLPHRGNIILIDRVIRWDEHWIEVAVEHKKPSLFTREDGSTPSWIGIEYMAQAIGAYVGIRALQAGQPVKVGFLMGANKFEATVPSFSAREEVTVRAEQVFYEGANLAVFNCVIFSDRQLAKAEIKAIQPDDPYSVLEGLSPV